MKLKLHHLALTALCGAAATPVWALQTQPQSNTQVGPAEIRDFTLPGTPPPPEPEPEPTPAPTPPPVAEPAEEPTAVPTPSPPVADEPSTPADEPSPTPERPDVERDGETSARSARPSRAEAAQTPDILPDGPAASPVEAPAASAPAPAPGTSEISPARADEGSGWLLPLLGILAAIAGGIAFLRWRRRREEEALELEPYSAPEPEPEPVPAPAPLPAPAAAFAATPAPASDIPGIVMRPWLELVFKPARASATDGGASVQYEAVIRNTGNAPARNVRLAARMFNSGQDIQAEVSQFFAMGVDAPDGAPLTILPRTEVALSSVVNMAREEMREIKVQGRSLFVPTVAFNLLYEWGRDKVGQTCSAHVIGREPDPPAEKMAPFRLDLGPRVYRSVGQRPSALARAL